MKLFSMLAATIISTLTFASIDHKTHWDGKSYDSNSSEQHQAAAAIINTLHLQGNELILDIGSGNGLVTSEIAKLVPSGRVIGMDISPSMVSFAIANYMKETPNLNFVEGKAQSFHFDQQFDLILSFTTLQWVKEQQAALDSIYQSLKPEGKLIIEMPQGLPDNLEKALSHLLEQETWSSYFKNFESPFAFFEKEEYQQLLEKAHLQPVVLDSRVVTHTFPHAQAFKGFIKQWFPWLAVLPENKKDLFLDELISMYASYQNLSEDSPIPFPVRRLRVEATK